MTLLQILVIAVVAFFCIVFVRDGLKHFIGYNPSAPSLWARIKAWWPGFVKRHIVDDDPYDDESHSIVRYEVGYDQPTLQQIECARAAAVAKLYSCRSQVCEGGMNCPVNEYCNDDDDVTLLNNMALAWLKSHGLKP